MSKTIFITGASRGFGKIWAEAFLDRGDKVIVTSKGLSGLEDLVEKYGNALLSLELEITNRASFKEQQIIWELYEKIAAEYHDNQDELTRDIILRHIGSILKYSLRFYKRQFINRFIHSGTTVTKFNKAIIAYFEKGLRQERGLPTVAMFAGELNLSPRYLSDLLKQETGKQQWM